MHDPWWMHAFLAVHITAGGGALRGSAGAGHAKGQGASHVGQDYFWCMTVVAFTHWSWHLTGRFSPRAGSRLQLLCGILAYRVLVASRLERRIGAPPLDGGRHLLLRSQPDVVSWERSAGTCAEPAIPAIVFGSLGCGFRTIDVALQHPPAERCSVVPHLQGMSAATLLPGRLFRWSRSGRWCTGAGVVGGSHIDWHTCHRRHDGLLSAEIAPRPDRTSRSSHRSKGDSFRHPTQRSTLSEFGRLSGTSCGLLEVPAGWIPWRAGAAGWLWSGSRAITFKPFITSWSSRMVTGRLVGL